MSGFGGVDLAIIAATFLCAGFVKGVVGLGLPLVSLAALTLAFDHQLAMALLIAPAFLTNVWQAFAGGGWRPVLWRLWPFLAPAVGFVFLGALALGLAHPDLLAGLLGVVMIVYAGLGLGGLRLRLDRRRERWFGPALGAVNGVLTGMTGSSATPGVMFLQALDMPRAHFIQALGMLFGLSTLALALALRERALLPDAVALVSLLAVAPALAGMRLGARFRNRLSERAFRRAILLVIGVLGLVIIGRAAAG